NCPCIFSVSQTVISANSFFGVTEIAVGIFVGGSRRKGSVPLAVHVPATATRPVEKTATPLLDQLTMPRAIKIGAPGFPPAFIHHAAAGSGRKPPHQGGSGFSVKQLWLISIIVTRSTPKPESGTYKICPCVLL